jgi:hypothetical protein
MDQVKQMACRANMELVRVLMKLRDVWFVRVVLEGIIVRMVL